MRGAWRGVGSRRQGICLFAEDRGRGGGVGHVRDSGCGEKKSSCPSPIASCQPSFFLTYYPLTQKPVTENDEPLLTPQHDMNMQEADKTVLDGARIVKLGEAARLRFWTKVDRNGPLPDQSLSHYNGLDRCWVWESRLDTSGYGVFMLLGKSLSSHRTSYFLHHGGYPPNHVLHRCDNPRCVNPDHLFSGDYQDNADDRGKKGRTKVGVGEAQHLAKLTAADILTIFEMKAGGGSQRSIASWYGLDRTTIRSVLQRKTWKHITVPLHGQIP